MIMQRFILPTMLLLAFSYQTYAVNTTLKENIQLTISRQIGAPQLQLHAKNAKYAEIFKKISQVTGTKLHFSAIPKGSITISCKKTNVPEILNCLLGPQLNMVYQHASQAILNTHSNSQNPKEIWILADANSSTIQAVTINPALASNKQHEPTLQDKTKQQLQQTLQRTKADNPMVRAQALVSLSNNHEANEQTIIDTLQLAYTDENDQVRQKALTGLVKRLGDAANAELKQSLLNDESDRVRATALSYISDDIALIEHALHDNSERVRSMAKLKLQYLQSE